MNKTIIGMGLCCLMAVNAPAQDSLRVRLTDGTSAAFALSDIDSLRFATEQAEKDTTLDAQLLPAVMARTAGLQIFSRLLAETGWGEKLYAYKDETFVPKSDAVGINAEAGTTLTPQARYYGFTVFAETDAALWEKGWVANIARNAQGEITNWDEIMQDVALRCRECYPDATSDDITSEENAVNQFVSYHLIKGKYAVDRLALHKNAKGWTDGADAKGVVENYYYETLGKQRRLLKVSDGETSDGIRLNRYTKVRDNGRNGTYEEIEVPTPGILLQEGGEALNGIFYTLNDVLWYDVPYTGLNERLRFDASCLFPELATHNILLSDSCRSWNFPNGFFENLKWNEESNCCYLWGDAYRDVNSDEMVWEGPYDITLKLPPVPYTGTYELRIGTSNNNLRGMVQLYVGTDPDNLAATGMPIDLRRSMEEIGVEADDPTDEARNAEADLALRKKGYMKAPKLYYLSNGQSFRDLTVLQPFRLIAGQFHFSAGETYYLRIQSVLEYSRTQGLLDYIEIVPRAVLEDEDIW